MGGKAKLKLGRVQQVMCTFKVKLDNNKGNTVSVHATCCEFLPEVRWRQRKQQAATD